MISLQSLKKMIALKKILQRDLECHESGKTTSMIHHKHQSEPQWKDGEKTREWLTTVAVLRDFDER